jgi:hypothetical protein
MAATNGGGVSSVPCSAMRGRRRSRQATLTANEPASNSIAAPAPMPPTITPASAGPAMLEIEKLSPRTALAGCSWPGCETVCGSSPVNAGWKNASALP